MKKRKKKYSAEQIYTEKRCGKKGKILRLLEEDKPEVQTAKVELERGQDIFVCSVHSSWSYDGSTVEYNPLLPVFVELK